MKRCGQVVELGADRRELRRAARRDTGLVMSAFELPHRLRQRPQRRQGPADHGHHQEKQRQRDRGADLELGDDGVPDLGDLVVGMRGDEERARLAMDRDGHADRGLLGMNQADEPGRRATRILVGIGPGRRQRVPAGIEQRDADMIGEATSRTNSGDVKKVTDFIKGPDFSVAAFKGTRLTLRDWNLQLRQPILLVDGRMACAELSKRVSIING